MVPLAARLAGLGLFDLARLFLDEEGAEARARVEALVADAAKPLPPFVLFASTAASDFFERGGELARRGEWEAALRCLDDVGRPESVQLPRGAALVASGRNDEAAVSLAAAAEASPEDALPALLLGFAHRQAGRFADAGAAFRLAHERGAEHWVVDNEIGVAVRDCGSHVDAVPWFRKAYDAKPNVGRVVGNLAYSLARCGELDEAIPLFRQTLALDADHKLARDNLGIALAMKDQYEDALPLLLRSTREDPENPALRNACSLALVHCAMARNADGKKSDAITFLDKAEALGFSGWTAELWQMRSWLRFDAGDFAGAAQAARAALELAPGTVAYRKDLGIALLRQGLHAEAIEIYEALKQEDLAKAYIPYLNIACCHALAGDPEAALRELEGAVARGISADSLEEDSDLTSLRPLPGFAALVERARGGAT